MNPNAKAAWADRRARIRKEMSRILKDIEAGHVNELDLAKLNNFVMTMCWMMSKVQPGTLDASIKEVEAAAWLTDSMEHWDVVMDADKVGRA